MATPTPPPESNSLDRKPLKRALKNCDEDAEVWLSTIDGFWSGRGRGEELSFL